MIRRVRARVPALVRNSHGEADLEEPVAFIVREQDWMPSDINVGAEATFILHVAEAPIYDRR